MPYQTHLFISLSRILYITFVSPPNIVEIFFTPWKYQYTSLNHITATTNTNTNTNNTNTTTTTTTTTNNNNNNNNNNNDDNNIKTTTSQTTTNRDLNAEHGLGKRINLCENAILEATLHKEDTGKERWRSGKNVRHFRQLAKG